MTELDRLLAERRELDRKIKELQNPKYEVDGAKFMKHNDYWVVYLQEVKSRECDKDRPCQHKQIVISDTKDDAIAYLGQMIDILNDLYNKITGKSK